MGQAIGIVFFVLFIGFGAQADFKEICSQGESSQQLFLEELKLQETWQKWVELKQFYVSHPMDNQDQILASVRQTVQTYQGKVDERTRVARLIVRAMEELQGFDYFLRTYQDELDRGKMIINSQEISDVSGNWYEERQDIFELFYAELETKYGPTLFKALKTLKTLDKEEVAFLERHFFEYYGKDLDLPWGDYFEDLHRYFYDTFYLAELFPKIGNLRQSFGSANDSTYGIKPELALENPEMTMLIAYEGKDKSEKDIRMNLSFHLSPFSNQGPSIQVCDFALSSAPLSCEPLSFQDWCTNYSR